MSTGRQVVLTGRDRGAARGRRHRPPCRRFGVARHDGRSTLRVVTSLPRLLGRGLAGTFIQDIRLPRGWEPGERYLSSSADAREGHRPESRTEHGFSLVVKNLVKRKITSVSPRTSITSICTTTYRKFQENACDIGVVAGECDSTPSSQSEAMPKRGASTAVEPPSIGQLAHRSRDEKPQFQR